MNWIKVEHATIGKPEIYDIADLCEMSAEEVLGHLLRLWVWADQQIESGTQSVTVAALRSVTPSSRFRDACVVAGWLRYNDDTRRYTFPNFERHMGKSAKSRATAADRQKRHREKRNGESVTVRNGSTVTRGEKRREESTDPHTPKGACRVSFDTWWQLVNNKIARPRAEKAFKAAQKRHDLSQGEWAEIATKLNDHCRKLVSSGASAIHPATYLNQDRWTDEVSDNNTSGTVEAAVIDFM